ncbi:MAG: hypothetical protein PHS54_00085 [Clostridia bacterium]|nr:hypothetical protein [Clostridia bacterium]
MIRRHWCNRYFPYKWNLKKIDPKIVEIKQKIIISNVKQYPVIMNDDLDAIIPIENLRGI